MQRDVWDKPVTDKPSKTKSVIIQTQSLSCSVLKMVADVSSAVIQVLENI